MIVTLVSSLIAGLIPIVVGSAVALAAQPLWSGRGYLAIAYGLAGVAAAATLSFYAFWILPRVGYIFTFGLLAICLGYLGFRRAWRFWRLMLPLTLLMLGIMVSYVSFMYLWDSPLQAFDLAARRFSHPLPVDNFIPALFADRIAHGASTHLLVNDCNGSDRPPLQAGLLLFELPIIAPLVGQANGEYGGSLVAQLLWIPAAYSFSRALGLSRKAGVLSTVFVALLGTTLLNSVFTWPKMLSAALVLVSAVFLMDAARRPSRFRSDLVSAVVVFGLALLAHGAAAFSIPLLIGLGIVAIRRQPVRRVLSTAVLGVAVAFAAYLPWILYQRFADPPGDRLLKWHLAGELSPADTRPFLDVLVSAYRALTPAQWVAGRLANLDAVFAVDPFATWASIPNERNAEFFSTVSALSTAFPLTLVVLLVVGILAIRRHRIRLSERRLLTMVGLSLLSILFWCLVMFLPGSTIVHQGSQVWLLVIPIVSMGWLAMRRRKLAWIVVAVQFLITLVVYWGFDESTRVHAPALVMVVLGVALCVLGGLLFGRSPERILVLRDRPRRVSATLLP